MVPVPDNARFGPVVIDLGVDQQWSPAAKRAHCRQVIWLKQRRVRLLGQFRMPERLGVSDALVQQPGIQVVESFEPQPRREEAFPGKSNLVLDLTLLPTRRGRAGNWIDEIMAAQEQEPKERQANQMAR